MDTNALFEQILIICSVIGFVSLLIVGMYIIKNMDKIITNKRVDVIEQGQKRRIHLHKMVA